MIICQNCGTTNNEATTTTCRTCGALLPIATKSSRSRRTRTNKKKKEKQKQIEKPPIAQSALEDTRKEKLELQEIPKEKDSIRKDVELQEIPKPSVEELDSNSHIKKEEVTTSPKSDILQEIPVQPYRSNIIDSQRGFRTPSQSMNPITEAFTELKSSVLDDQKKQQSVPLMPITSKPTGMNATFLRQKQLEKDMTKVLSFLSKKISVKKLDIPEFKSSKEIVQKEEIPPSSMNEILKRLITLDLNIEASAIIKTDGTILASAISSRISDSLFATIGMNLSMMGADIIEGLNAGNLKSISVRGSEGILDLAPIDNEDPSAKDMILVILSHPKTKSGIISFAINIVKKQLKEYLGLQK